MSIEVRVPEEIADYKESIIAGLSIRQLICGGIALLCGIPTFLLFKNKTLCFFQQKSKRLWNKYRKKYLAYWGWAVSAGNTGDDSRRRKRNNTARQKARW